LSAFMVLKGGISSLIEDFGRYGLCDKGITNSGVMDEYAYMVLNSLLQNQPNTNCVEIKMGGFKLEARDSCTIAATGADAHFSINSVKQNIWRTHNIKKGDILEFEYAKNGVMIYFGVKGGFDIKKELGSNSTTLKEGIGQNLKKGDLLRFSHNETQYYQSLLKEKFIPLYPKELEIRVVLGYQNSFFKSEEIENFFSKAYIVSRQFNRMGYRLEGEPIECDIGGIISEGISFGAIQIPKDGKPIILLKERQTIGGYPKIGSALPIDCFKLSQLKAGDRVKFKAIEIEEAQKKMKIFKKALNLRTITGKAR